MSQSVITGTGCCIPATIKQNMDFQEQVFYDEKKVKIDRPFQEIAGKLRQITGIAERRYAPENTTAADLGTEASRLAIEDSGIDREDIDQIILAHNFGNVHAGCHQSDTVPALASRVKHNLGITNPACIPYDLIFGCPGWLQGIIQADSFLTSGLAKTCLIIGTETLSRVIDPFDRDSMIFADGAGACILKKGLNSQDPSGMLSYSMRSDSIQEVNYINFGDSYNPHATEALHYIKMKGRKVYEYALKHVPLAMKECLDKSGIPINELKKIFIHQANEKMDEAIIKEFYKLYGISLIPQNIAPMSIHWLGNSSVATIPTLFDLVRKGRVEGHKLQSGDIILFASVGAGMNINAVCYRY